MTNQRSWAPVALAVPLVLACHQSSNADKKPTVESVGIAKQALTADVARVFGFEQPSDWSAPVALTQSGVHEQGDYSLGVATNGWTEVNSALLSSLGEVSGPLGLSLRLPETPGWGELRVILIAPSLSLWYEDLGGFPLSSLAANQFHHFDFALSPTTQEALSGSYSDLQIRVVLNVPNASAPYLLDNLTLGEGGATGSEQRHTAVFPLPKGVAPSQVVLGANGMLDVRNGSTSEASAFVSNLGDGATAIGIESKTGSLFSKPDVTIDHDGQVQGDLVTTGTVTPLEQVTGSVQQGVAIATQELGFQVSFPSVSRGPIDQQAGPALDLPPGRNNGVNVKPDATLKLSTGAYYFDNFVFESGSTLRLDETLGPVEVYVLDGVTMRGRIETTTGDHPELLIVDFGSSTVFLEAAFHGTVVAPNAQVVLGTTSEGHSGAFFAKDILFRPNTTLSLHASSALVPVRPFVNCVRELGGTEYEAVFGYEGASNGRLDLPVGPLNRFSPSPEGRGQPEAFIPHRVESAFVTRFSGSSLSWTLAGRTATATPASPACPAPTCSDCGATRTCVGGQCVALCGDGMCGQAETCGTCPADCGCPSGQACQVGGGCATPARCGIEWECGSGTSFGVSVDCGTCPENRTCMDHACQ